MGEEAGQEAGAGYAPVAAAKGGIFFRFPVLEFEAGNRLIPGNSLEYRDLWRYEGRARFLRVWC